MKYILKAIASEIASWLGVIVICGVLAGLVWLVNWLFGQNTIPIVLLVALIVVEVMLIAEKASKYRREAEHKSRHVAPPDRLEDGRADV